eukprot:m.106834 g.106834  ORF g.106834 m.106834 type:complete len:445 (+) comp8955_c2_seq7:562-1896(+)
MGAQQARERAVPQMDKMTGEGSIEHSSNSKLRFGFSACQGWRKEMEDAHSCVETIESLPGSSYFGVFDGHGGAGAAHYVSKHLLQKIEEHFAARSEGELHDKLAVVLPAAFVAMDDDMADHPKDYVLPGESDESGSTAITAIVTPTHIVVAHLGDARAVLCRGGKADFSTKDHKPDNPEETKRIVDAGGFVAAKRVCRCLAVSRAFGDHYFKSKEARPEARMVSSVPDVAVIARQPEDEFLLLACDGVWDVMDPQQACDFVREQLLGASSIAAVCSALVDRCLQRGSTDNITAMLVCFSAAKSSDVVEDMIDSWFDDITPGKRPLDEDDDTEDEADAAADVDSAPTKMDSDAEPATPHLAVQPAADHSHGAHTSNAASAPDTPAGHGADHTHDAAAADHTHPAHTDSQPAHPAHPAGHHGGSQAQAAPAKGAHIDEADVGETEA